MPARRASRASRTTWLADVARDADRREIARVEARQHRDREDLRPAQPLARGRRAPPPRDGRAASSPALPEACRLKIRTPSRAASTPARATVCRDVVELEVEEDLAAVPVHHAHDVGPGVHEELLADLEVADLAAPATARAPPPRRAESTSSATISRCRGRRRTGASRRRPAHRPGSRACGDPRRDLADRHLLPPRPRAAPSARRSRAASARGPTVTRSGNADQVGVLELDARAARRGRRAAPRCRPPRARAQTRSAVSRSVASPTFTGTTCARERRERHRPDDAVVVVVLLDRRGHGARDADAVAAHLDRLLLRRRRRGSAPSWPREYFVPR